jgi:hypothetical protein
MFSKTGIFLTNIHKRPIARRADSTRKTSLATGSLVFFNPKDDNIITCPFFISIITEKQLKWNKDYCSSSQY